MKRSRFNTEQKESIWDQVVLVCMAALAVVVLILATLIGAQL